MLSVESWVRCGMAAAVIVASLAGTAYSDEPSSKAPRQPPDATPLERNPDIPLFKRPALPERISQSSGAVRLGPKDLAKVGPPPTTLPVGPHVTVVLRGLELAIPKRHLDPLVKIRGERWEDKEAWWLAYLPNFTPMQTKLPLDSGHGDRVYVRVVRGGSLNGFFASVAAQRDPATPFTDAYGLRAFQIPSRNLSEKGRLIDIYFTHIDQGVTTLIHCEAWHASPRCEHYFEANGSFLRLRYHFAYLPQWKKIQAGIAALHSLFARP